MLSVTKPCSTAHPHLISDFLSEVIVMSEQNITSLTALYASEAQKITNTSVDHAHYEYAIQIFPDVKVFCKFDFHILLPWLFSSFLLKFNTRCFLG